MRLLDTVSDLMKVFPAKSADTKTEKVIVKKQIRDRCLVALNPLA
jgi:hypothetical protein